MQNRYVGDIGDFVKFAILRAFVSGERFRQLGVAWWLHPDEMHNNDGGHRQYLQRPDKWRDYDHDLFDKLAQIDRSETRDIRALEEAQFVDRARYFSVQVPSDIRPFAARPEERRKWIALAGAHLEACDLVFLDPDNGIASEKVKATQKRSGKSVMLDDLATFRKLGRTLIVYHHQGRPKGGHCVEAKTLFERLENAGFHVCGALRARSVSPRLFLIVDGDDGIVARAKEIAQLWDERMCWIPSRCMHTG